MRRFAIVLVILPVLATLYVQASTSTPEANSHATCPIAEPGPPPVCPAGCTWDGYECRKHSGIIMPDRKVKADDR